MQLLHRLALLHISYKMLNVRQHLQKLQTHLESSEINGVADVHTHQNPGHCPILLRDMHRMESFCQLTALSCVTDQWEFLLLVSVEFLEFKLRQFFVTM